MRNKVINVIKYGITAIAIINLILMFGFNYRIMGIDFLEYVRGNQNQIQYVSSTAETAATAEAAEEIEKKEPEPEPEKKNKKCRVTSKGNLRVRSGPGTNYGVVGSVSSGTVLEVWGEEEGWIHIRMEDGKDGYVSGEYVEMLND